MQPLEYADFIAAANSIPELFWKVCEKYPSAPAYTYPEHTAESKIIWHSRSRADSLARVKNIAAFLRTKGVTPGTAVGIIAGTRPEWTESDLAILACGGITVSVYPSLPAADAGFILADAGCSIIFCENQEQLEKIRAIEAAPVELPARDDIPASTAQIKFSTVICFEEVISDRAVHSFSEIVSQKNNFTPDQTVTRETLSSLVYTSGTTGPSKGVMQTHGNHLANVEQATRSGVFGLDGSLFLFLPLAHSFARLIAYLGALTQVKVVFCSVANKQKSVVDLVLVAKEMASADAQIIPSVPRLFEKIKSTLQQPKPGLGGALLRLTLWTAPQKWNPLRLLTTPIRNKIKKKIFGSFFQHAISGGAKLPASVAQFFADLGITIYEGYGLTETCVATNVNLPNRWKIGSVGPAFDQVQVKIAEDGEILFKGPNITQGYWKRPVATKESWDTEGWFHTGDIGHLDQDGFLYITDRKKDLVVTAGGKKIPPQRVETLLLSYPLISHAIYFGDDKPFCIALLGLSPHTLSDQQLASQLETIKKKVNSQLASFESIKKFAILPEELTIENGALTPTLKVKRKEVIKRFRDLIEAQYRES